MTIQQRIRVLVWPVCLLVASLPAPAQTDLSDLTVRVEALVSPQADAKLLSGVVLIAKDGDVFFHRAYGFANWELQVPNGLDTRFGVASVTKIMTEALVHVLVSEGRLDLDAAVEQYLPGFPTGPHGGVPTVRHLLTHRSGVPHRVTTDAEETQVWQPSDIVERVGSRGLLFEPGTGRLYSSAGFTSLARAIEVIEERRFDDVLAHRIFRPAGMATAMSETGQRLMPRRALPHRLGTADGAVVVKSAPYKDLRFLTGAGSVYATAADVWNFVRAVQDGTFGPSFRDDTFGQDSARWTGWTGRTNGYEASVDILADDRLTFVFLSNLQSAANWQIREGVREILVGSAPRSISPPPRVAESFEAPASLLGQYGPATIALRDDALFRGDNEFYPIAGERYYIPASGSLMRFRRSADGVVDAIIAISGDGRETLLPRTTP